jgi:hypothetical protein
MKKSLLATVAVAALIAGHGFAYAEGAPKQDAPKQEAPAQKTEAPAPAPSAQQKAPAEKIAPAAKGAEMKAPDAKADVKADTKSDSKASTTGQAEPKASAPKAAEQQKSSEPSRGATQPQSGQSSTTQQPNAQQQGGTSTGTQQQGAQQRSGTQQQTTGAAPSSGGVALTTEQKTEIRSSVLTSSAPRVTNVNFSINVGTVVPRTVRVVAVPDTLVRIHPAWRGHRYFVYNDEIIIVEADTLRIVAVLVV